MQTTWTPSTEKPPSSLVNKARAEIPSILSEASIIDGKCSTHVGDLVDKLKGRSIHEAAAEWAIQQCIEDGSLQLLTEERQVAPPQLSRSTMGTRGSTRAISVVVATDKLWRDHGNRGQKEPSTHADRITPATSAQPGVDLGIFIALEDEFRVFRDFVGGDKLISEPVDDTGEQFYSFTVSISRQCVVSFGGQKGEQRATRVVERMIQRFHPKLVAVVGIAGALSKDLRLCDVVVATQADSYMEAAKAIPTTGIAQTSDSGFFGYLRKFNLWPPASSSSPQGFQIKLAGEPYRTSHAIKIAINNLEFSRSSTFESWVNSCSTELASCLTHAAIARNAELINDRPKMYCGPIASGPIVGASPEYTKLLLDHNRNYLAIEMESAGVLASTHERMTQPQTIIIRGISDFADDRKSQLDITGSGVYRTVAMKNAVRLLWCIFESELLSRLEVQPVPSTEIQTAPRCIINGCDEGSISLQVDSIISIIDTLKDHFDFRWEPGSFRDGAPTIFWPVRLRRPTPIHAVQTFAAAALSRQGARVVLCLDDLGNKEHSAPDFEATITRWWTRVAGTATFTTKLFSEILGMQGNDAIDPWPIVEKWLGQTNRRLDEILRISKVLNAEDKDDSPIAILKKPRPRRILNPPVVWACIQRISEEFHNTSLITLGGHDECLLWDAWRAEMVDGSLRVGHLYIPILGETPLHMAKIPLHWASREDILKSLQNDVAADPAGWLNPRRIVPWCLRGCIALPDYVESHCTRISKFTVRDDSTPEIVIPSLHSALENRLLRHV